MNPRARIITRWVLAACLVIILTIAFWPTPVDRPFDAQLARTLSVLHGAGMPAWLDYDFVESAANVIMFVPFGALIALYATPRLWWTSVAAGFVLSVGIELFQKFFLPQRFASVGDVIANTAGALIGGGIVALLRMRADARKRRAAAQ
ncbi:MAG TPA: VanZ family protein [Microbacteriaceae bacterium]